MKLERQRMPWIPKKKEVSWNTTDFDYHSSRWIKDRALYLKANPLCIECKKEGKTTPATISDHIIPISEGGDEWDWNNRQPLCVKHHNQKNARERNIKYKK